MTTTGPDNGESVTEAWSDPAWLESATAWLDDRLQEAGLDRTSQVTQPYVQPWATVLTAATGRGRVWLKAMAPGTTFEIGLYELLVTVAPENVLTPIAADPSRGWILLPDGGVSLGDRPLDGSDLVEHMLIALPQYAALQRSTIPYLETLLELGLGDLRPAVLPGRFDDCVETCIHDDIRGQLSAIRPRFVEWCHRLAESAVSPCLDHNDLHPWNILGITSTVPGSAQRKAVFYDWGDSIVAHPFGSALGSVSRVRRELRLDPDHRDVRRMSDAYLQVFDDMTSGPDMHETLELACRVAKAARAVVWDRSEESIREYLEHAGRGDYGI
ncbi:MAG TPA: aminoglycoside phosphotransferase family protein [Acidimicrobiia bacterium]|nr:aminoglycoside phosphotransferase family protein [Acidimicrobiia bacterium]